MTSWRGNQTPAERGSAAYSGPSKALSFPLVPVNMLWSAYLLRTLSLSRYSMNTTRARLGLLQAFSPRRSESCHVPQPTLSPTL
jgi:hypothetical protein